MVGKRLKHVLDIHGISQRELAKSIGVTEASISRYINGVQDPNVETIVKICKSLHISADWLLGIKEDS